MTAKQTYPINWQGIEISIFYQPDYSKAHKEIIGQAIAHIEVKANEPLPITKTGYRSLFLAFSEVEENGGAVLLVQKWLEEMAQSKDWKLYRKEQMQLKLF